MRTTVLLPQHDKKDLKRLFADAVESEEEYHTIDGTAIKTLPTSTIVSMYKAFVKAKARVAAKKAIIIKTSNTVWAAAMRRVLLARHKNITVEYVDDTEKP